MSNDNHLVYFEHKKLRLYLKFGASPLKPTQWTLHSSTNTPEGGTLQNPTPSYGFFLLVPLLPSNLPSLHLFNVQDNQALQEVYE